MSAFENYMKRCIELAKNGMGNVSPNPLVGAVIVHNEKIIGEGWHKKFGEEHAEVNAINSVKDKSILEESTLFVNLEPCSHHGKTPPCGDLIIQYKFKKVVIGITDPFEKVSGKGILKLKDAGIEVIENILQKECEELNKRFITFVTKKRPYIILKWAQTADGFLAPDITNLSEKEFKEKRHITGFTIQKLVHKWRSEEDAILIGTNTAITDDPALNVRAWIGRNPVRIIIDKNLWIPLSKKINDDSIRTIIFTEKSQSPKENTSFEKIEFNADLPNQIIEYLFKKNIQSVIIEGGRITLKSFIDKELWDEAQIFTSPKIFGSGIASPQISGISILKNKIDNVQLEIIKNSLN